jgi:hypothetical protein
LSGSLSLASACLIAFAVVVPAAAACCFFLLAAVYWSVRGLFSGVGCGPDGKTAFKSGDVISLSFDLSGIRAVLSFRLNGAPMDSARVEDIKGDVYPAVSVADGAVLQANFGAMPFKYPPPEGFSEVILSQSLI